MSRTTRPCGLPALGLVVALGLAAFAASAESPGGAPSAPAAAAAPLAAGPTLASDVPGAEISKAPTAAEWTQAKPVTLTRVSPRTASCRAVRLREWIRVRCASKTFAISLLGGDSGGLSFWIGTEPDNLFGEVQLPMRRGDRRVVQLWATRDDPSGVAPSGTVVVEPWLVLQELWAEGDAGPTVTVL